VPVSSLLVKLLVYCLVQARLATFSMVLLISARHTDTPQYVLVLAEALRVGGAV
jgi:hypothetical protein